MPTFNVNTDALVSLTNKLEKLHRSDLPIAIRNTLTKAAVLTKKESLPKSSGDAFINRNKTFFKAKSKFLPAKGFDVNQMKATIGMVDRRRDSDDHAVRNLEQQEHGGTIGGRAFIPTDRARVGGGREKNVAPRNRIGRISIRNVVRSRLSKGKTKEQRFIKSVTLAKNRFGARAHVLTRNMLFRVDSLGFNRKARGLKLKVTPLYTYKRNRSIKVSASNFMRRATLVQAKKLGVFYKNEAEKRIKRAMK